MGYKAKFSMEVIAFIVHFLVFQNLSKLCLTSGRPWKLIGRDHLATGDQLSRFQDIIWPFWANYRWLRQVVRRVLLE